ncbi:AraC family transcriptional regulator [uncultured Acetobacteroides sp.]|uniref:AraC family transcriptional regulator n=1 Tax=uncultured Acetobacteroides sp. TaxID=1760811 RepID=UPI0029F59F20|nr:AraC family transcriptional regulator [uncultured Acetobacteroides sp.]
MNKYQKEYIYRINRVIDYIEANINKELSLERLSDVANFSPFHFHRIFSAFTGETLNGFIKRKRIERAASILLSEPDTSITEVAYYCGYNSPSVFCRNFKERFKVSAQEFRSSWDENSKNRQLDSKSGKLDEGSNAYVCDIESQTIWRKEMKNVIEVREMPAMNVIYCRHKGEYNQIGAAYDKLFKWAGPRGLLNHPECKGITYYHDDPKVTAQENIRQSACITVFEDVKTEGEIGKMQIPGGRYAVGHFEVNEQEFQQAWDSMCLWVAQSGYQPADASPYELYHNNHEEHPQKKFIVDICIPVKPL